MSLFERYLAEVERRLPEARRDDILSEVRSLLEDALDARRSDAADTRTEEELAAEVLVEFGPPGDFAAAYHPERQYLVGPRYFPGLLTTVKICFWVLLAIIGVGFVVDVLGGFDSPLDFVLAIAASFSNLVSTGIALFGLVVLIFAIVERTTPENNAQTRADWDPSTLPQPEDPQQVDVAGTMVGMALAAVALIVFNLIPDQFCVRFEAGGEDQTVPLLGDAFAARLPWLNAYLLLGVGLGALVLRLGRWSRWLRLGDFLVHLLIVVFFYHLASGEMVIELGSDWLIHNGVAAEDAENLSGVVKPILVMLRIGLWVAFVVAAYSGVQKLRALRNGPGLRTES